MFNIVTMNPATATAPRTLDEEANDPIIFHQRGTREWNDAWALLVGEFGNPECRNPEDGEIWQYMGTSQEPSGRWVHHFRHRSLPGWNASFNRSYPANISPFKRMIWWLRALQASIR